MSKHGAFEEFLSDNLKIFTNQFDLTPSKLPFGRACHVDGVNHLLTAPFSTMNTGKGERSHRTFR